MGITGRARMIRSINELVGDDSCTEAIVLQERRPTFWGAMIVGALAGGVLSEVLGLSGLVRGALIGGFIGIGAMLTLTVWVLARTSSGVVLARSSRLYAKAVAIEETAMPPVGYREMDAIINKKISIFNREVVVSRAFVGRLDAIVG